MTLTKFSGFSEKSIDILDFHDSETNNLRRLEITFFNSILSARLISVLDFILRSRDGGNRTSIAVKLDCRLKEGLT
jgi:hypothetical protein